MDDGRGIAGLARRLRWRRHSVPGLLALALLSAGPLGCAGPEATRVAAAGTAAPGASATERARRDADRQALFDADRDGRLSEGELRAAVTAEERARHDPETVMLFEALREAYRTHLEAAAAGDQAATQEAAAELAAAQEAYRARREAMLAAPPQGP